MSIPGGIASRSPPALDETREDPPQEHPGEDEEPDGDGEREADGETGEGGHGEEFSVLGCLFSELTRTSMDHEEGQRHSSSKAVVAALLLAGVALLAIVVVVLVVLQRACFGR
jgi:hypothetical protein